MGMIGLGRSDREGRSSAMDWWVGGSIKMAEKRGR